MFSLGFDVEEEAGLKSSWIGIASIVAGVLVIIFPNLIDYLIGTVLIVAGILHVVGRVIKSKGD
tara:strand:- start:441 stop:632 length:192 start_codon:yes stop_codon:yes gene_type:complete